MSFELTMVRHSFKEKMNFSINDSLLCGISLTGVSKAKKMGSEFKNKFNEIIKIKSGFSKRCVETGNSFIDTYNSDLNLILDENDYGNISIGSFVQKNKLNSFINYLINNCFSYYGYDKYNELFHNLYEKEISKYQSPFEYYTIFSENHLINQNSLIITNGTNIGAILTALSFKYDFKYDSHNVWPKYLSGIKLEYDEKKKIKKIKFISFFYEYEEFSLFTSD